VGLWALLTTSGSSFLFLWFLFLLWRNNSNEQTENKVTADSVPRIIAKLCCFPGLNKKKPRSYLSFKDYFFHTTRTFRFCKKNLKG
jgi:hypothetical protein